MDLTEIDLRNRETVGGQVCAGDVAEDAQDSVTAAACAVRHVKTPKVMPKDGRSILLGSNLAEK